MLLCSDDDDVVTSASFMLCVLRIVVYLRYA